ncbi:MAG: hypothetical protein GEU28_14735 [Dehalococcoidia bacterium]|nr:hypothetical protein [Dehalococcoidia bacterium]
MSDQVDVGALEATFHEVHRARYGHCTPGLPVELVNLRVAAWGAVPRGKVSVPEPEPGDPMVGRRQVVFDGCTYDTPVLARDRLASGVRHEGPLLINEESATTVVPPGHEARVDELRNLLITSRQRRTR